MASPNWTTQQRAGIDTVGKGVLVSAAAGSGKTAVLSERCAHLICDARETCNVDELLVVTFTNDAAAEMRSRIEAALRGRLDALQDGNSDRLERQIALLDRAQISTIHSFCINVLRQHFHLLGLDPGFKVMDESEGILLRAEIARELFGKRYDDDKTGEFARFIDDYADGNDEQLVQRVIGMHGLLGSIVDPAGWIMEIGDRLHAAAREPLAESSLGKVLFEVIGSRLKSLRDRAAALSWRIEEIVELEPYRQRIGDILDHIDLCTGHFNKKDLDAISKAIRAIDLGRLPTIRNAPPQKDRIQKQLNELKTELIEGGVAELCRFTEAEWREGLAKIETPSRILLELVQQFGEQYAGAKREQGVLDFGDLERLALDVLRDPEGTTALKPSAVAKAYHKRFAHVLVDEYQDINGVQDAILHLVSRESEPGAVSNLFCVGDVKQSIYGFRLADPKRFIDRSEILRDGINGAVIDLQTNFRSRKSVLDTLNGLFERIITKETADIDYDESQKLHSPEDSAYLKYPSSDSPLEIHLLPKAARAQGEDSEDSHDLDRTEREAAFVARRISELLDTNVVAKSAAGELEHRRARYGDIAILLRAPHFKAEQFADILRRWNVPVHIDSGAGFFASTEIRDMLALLCVLDNLRQDVPLAAVLRSPLFGLANPDDCLARIRLAYPIVKGEGPSFHEAVVKYADEQHDELAAFLRDFLTTLNKWRETSRFRPPALLIWQIYYDTGYLAYCTGLRDGEQRVANLIELHERARQFGTFQRQGLSRFLQFIETLRQETDVAPPSVASAAEDAVRVMSIHKSKGLEFPIVFVADLGKQHNQRDTAGRIVVDRTEGLALDVVDQQRQIIYPSLASVLVRERIRRKSLQEEMRVLYVALTRAREKLILVGTVAPDTAQNWTDAWSTHVGPLPSDTLMSAKTMFDWVGPAATAMRIAITTHSEEEIIGWKEPRHAAEPQDDAIQQLAELKPLVPEPQRSESADRLIARLNRSYGFPAFTKLDAAQSVSDLTKHALPPTIGADSKEVTFERVLVPPRCAGDQIEPSPTDIGDATHQLLQHVDFTQACDVPDLRSQLDRLVKLRLIAPAMAETIELEHVAWLMSSEIGSLLRRHAGTVRREWPIYFAMNPLNSTDPYDRVMVRGRIDAMIPLPQGAVLIDYKTDFVTKKTIDSRIAVYRPQIGCYRDAVTALLDQPPSAGYLIFLKSHDIVKL